MPDSAPEIVGPADPEDADTPADAGRTQGGSVGRTVARLAVGVGAVLAVGSLVVVAVEQHRQTEELRHQTCFARASALAQVGSFELARGSGNLPDPGLVALLCDGE